MTKLEIYSIKPNYHQIAHQNIYLYFNFSNKYENEFFDKEKRIANTFRTKL